ncbi:MAG: hypothetical protein A2V70_05315 [Planctomycetes bacterium RBG_13_63_9]|nr:MAG: hypothetical protein A2V70_05315 [Planctomycetes bacterium RBG_13_63_9]
MPRAKTRNRRRSAYTYLELAIVVLIVGILAAITVPRFIDSLSYHRVDSTARRIEADLQLARQHAMATSSNHTVSFLVGSDRYSISPKPGNFGHDSTAYVVRLSDAPHQVSLVSADFGGDADVVFSGHGLPDSSGAVVIRSGNYQQTISLDQESGTASVEAIESVPTVP